VGKDDGCFGSVAIDQWFRVAPDSVLRTHTEQSDSACMVFASDVADLGNPRGDKL
jgi:hypothetical protein